MIDIRRLRKVYRGGVVANDDVTLSIGAGAIHGLLGHNGAGKSTLINQIAGLLVPTSGTIRLAGGDPVADPAFARRACALQPQAQVPLQGLSPRQAVGIMARIRGAGRRQARSATDRLLATLDIERWADVPGERLPGGVRRLTAFCMVAAAPAPVLMLDEPTNDVDPARRRLLWQTMRALADDGHAVVVVTHNVAEAERHVDRLAILHRGRVVAEGTPAAVRGDQTLEKVYLELAGEESDALAA